MKDINDFLSAIFHAVPQGATGCIAATHVSKDSTVYPAYPYPAFKLQDFHTHFGVGCHLPEDPAITDRSKFRRTKETWQGMPVLMLDDVGEAKKDMVIGTPDLEPSFIVETKPGSQQWGYILDVPIVDYAEARLLLVAAVAAGINDAGGQNPARLVRLPGSLPHGKKHRAKLANWTGKHFTKDELITGLKLDLSTALDLVVSATGRNISPGDTPPVALGNDPVVTWLDAQGLVLGDGEVDGFIDIVCPWHQNHTDGAINGTGYRPPMDSDPYRSFHCFHRCSDLSHVQGGKNTKTFLEWIKSQGGPDVGTLDETARDARRAHFRNLRKNVPAGSTDPVLMEHVRELKVATLDEEKFRRMNSIIWLLCEDQWGDAELVNLITRTLGMGGPDILKTARWIIKQIDDVRHAQAANQRRDRERNAKRSLTQAERIGMAAASLTRLSRVEQQAMQKWLGEQLDG